MDLSIYKKVKLACLNLLTTLQLKKRKQQKESIVTGSEDEEEFDITTTEEEECCWIRESIQTLMRMKNATKIPIAILRLLLLQEEENSDILPLVFFIFFPRSIYM